MRITRLIQVASLGVVLALGSTAVYAKGHASQQTHHCRLADGTTDASKTHKQCSAAKGTWAKDAAATSTTAAAPAAASTPAAPAAPATPTQH